MIRVNLQHWELDLAIIDLALPDQITMQNLHFFRIASQITELSPSLIFLLQIETFQLLIR